MPKFVQANIGSTLKVCFSNGLLMIQLITCTLDRQTFTLSTQNRAEADKLIMQIFAQTFQMCLKIE